MPLTPGTRLGPYEITALLGEGGMGQVYRATDTTLGRQVAIKILPEALAADPDRLARFEREAKTLASLNHPHIAAIYGFEKSSGSHALVMELVEGADLSQRIARGAIPIDEALPIATQIAEALEAAHEQGIVHRDLKPANIKVRADGTVKVLDFGLAKAAEPQGSGVRAQGATESPTITSPAMTQAGMILGTAAYMAPEQARGRAVDKRADIWAFGAVLYEMLAGARAFGGDDVAETLANVINREPAWEMLPATVPARVMQALRVCLRKDAKQRAHDMADVRLALEGAFETAAPQTTAAAAPPAARGRLAWVAFAVAVAVIAGMAVPTLRHLREAPASLLPETRVDLVTPDADQPTAFALSPDGRQIVFVASGDGAPRLWVRSLATTTAQPLAGTDGAQFPFWSPDSRSVGFFADGQLKRLELSGGVPQTLAPASAGRGGTWNADGVILFGGVNRTPLVRVPASGGSPVAVTTLGQQSSHKFPSFLPDGRHFLFYALGTSETTGIYLGTLDASDAHRLTAAEAAGAFVAAPSAAADGWLLWVRGGTLVAQRLDVARAALVGDPVTLADPVVVDRDFNVAAVSVSASGLVAYRAGEGNRRQLTWVDGSGKVLGPLGAPEVGLLDPRVSPDGQRVAVSRVTQGNQDIWLFDDLRTSRITFDAASDRFPIWSPDGSRIAFSSTREGPYDLYEKGTSSAGAEERLLASPEPKIATDWSADGRSLIYFSADPQTSRDVWELPLAKNSTPRVFLKTPFNERDATFSPDGRWVAYESNESGRDEIYIRPFSAAPASGAGVSAAGEQWQVSTAGGINPLWRPDGKGLYYLNPQGAIVAAPIAIAGATVVPGAPVVLFPVKIVGGGEGTRLGRQYDVAPDGRFLINTELADDVAAITLIQNWNPEAKK